MEKHPDTSTVNRQKPPEGILPAPDERVLSTLNKDGTRRWLRPRLSTGRFLRRRQILGYSLIVIFTVIPYLSMNGKPLVLLDIPSRKFTLFGTTFLATDTFFLMLFILSVFVTIILLTAIFGRVWCGWGCPQTVYLELVYRPLERFFDGAPGKKKPKAAWRRVAKYPTYLFVSAFFAHTFIAYFVGVDELFQWVQSSPFEHPSAFAIMVLVTGAMMFDFCYFREQTCLVACPYGRFQSALLDRHSLIVGYDYRRGEPRGKGRKRTAETGGTDLGDCIDCHMCVTTCPTGIDIRDGLQLECIHCTQCIDACDSVMDKVGKPRGLIRYSSQDQFAGKPHRFLRPRVIAYPLILMVIVSLLVFNLATKSTADVTILRQSRTTFEVQESGLVLNRLHVKIVNRSDDPQSYAIFAEGAPGLEIVNAPNTLVLESGESFTTGLEIVCEPVAFESGPREITIRVTDENGLEIDKTYKLLGPRGPRLEELIEKRRATSPTDPTKGE